MTNPFHFDFEIHQVVTVRALDLPGMVIQRCDRGAGNHDYQVVFWADGERKVEWLMSWEIKVP